MFSLIAGLFTNSWLKWAGVAILCGLIVILTYMLKGATERAAVAEDRYLAVVVDMNQMSKIAQAERKKAITIIAKKDEDLALSAEVSEGRRVQLIKIYGQVAHLKTIARPEHEKNCPVHPAYAAAIGFMRGEAAEYNLSTSDRGHLPDSTARTSSMHGRTGVPAAPVGR